MTHPIRFRSAMVLAVVLLLPLAGACAPSVSSNFDDATITARVKTILLNDKEVGVLPIEVDTFDGVVTLSGSVKTEAQRDQAVALARKAVGAKDVRSTLAVTPQAP